MIPSKETEFEKKKCFFLLQGMFLINSLLTGM